MRPGCSQHQVKSGAAGGTRLESEPQSTGHGRLHMLSSASGTRTAHMVLATSDPATGWGPPLPSPSSGLARMVPLLGRLCPHGPKNPQPLCTSTDHFPHWRRENILPRCRQPCRRPPPAPSQDLAQTLGLSQGFSQMKGEMTGCSALPCPGRSPTSPRGRSLPGCPCLYCQDSVSNSSGLSSPSWPLH